MSAAQSHIRDSHPSGRESMSIIDRNVSVTMVRDSLAGIPFYALPEGYSIRLFSAGDRRTWVDLVSAAERYFAITDESFDQAFGKFPALLDQRQFFWLTGQIASSAPPQRGWIRTTMASFMDRFTG